MIFWEHIKGLNRASDTNAWTYLNFQNTIDGLKMTSNPSLGFGDNGYSRANNYLLSSDMVDGYISNTFNFLNEVNFKSTTNQLKLSFDSTNSEWVFRGTGASDAALPVKIFHSLNIGESLSVSGAATVSGIIRIESSTSSTAYNNGALIVSGGVGIGGDLHVHSSCHADYFNATSDYRAKKDFKLLDIDALELIKKVKLYSFKYKESNQPSIGIIAQDIQNININGFDLVDNKEATGDNFDYMSIHESKLIYILWKAIQEQQKEIEDLKLQLNK